MRRGPKPETVFHLDKDEIWIGRGSKNDIIIHDNEVSREHALLRRTKDGYEIEDLSSSNGTFVNGQPVDGVWLLQSHCIIELGDMITFEYFVEDAKKTDKLVAPTVNAPHYLIVRVNSQNEPAIYPLNDIQIKVGRGVSNDIVIVEPEMSREHFQLALLGRSYVIRDLGSTNGTMVNGELLADEVVLKPNDVIQIGTMVQMQYSTSAETFFSEAPTKALKDPPPDKSDTDPGLKRKIAAAGQIAEMMRNKTGETTYLGTGVEHVNLKDRVLVTYARDDWETIVAPLVGELQNESIDTWVDQYLIEGDKDWQAATEQARLECWLLVVVVTRAALRSDLVRRNWRHFHNREKPIILIVRDLVEKLPIGSEKLSHVDYNPAVPQVAFKQLADEIKRLKS